MKTRNELAHDYLCAIIRNDEPTDGPHADAAVAFALADAFLAAAGLDDGYLLKLVERLPAFVTSTPEVEARWWAAFDHIAGMRTVQTAAAGKQPQGERKPDAVIVLDHDGICSMTDATFDALGTRLLAGRERVRLLVYLEEVE